MDNNLSIRVENVSKKYRLGAIGGQTLREDLQSWAAKLKGKEDPNSKIGASNIRATGDFWALKNISFEVQKGERIGIIGHNGAGKSTLLKLLSRVTAPSEGKISYNGRIASMLEVGTGFHPELTGRENVYMTGAILGMTKAEIASKLDEIVDFSGCERYLDTPVKRYSSGMMVRLGFAVAAHLDPEILVVDEVLAVGDAEFQKKAIGKMQDVSKGEGRTVLFVSHNMASVKSLCKTGVLLENGSVKYIGGINETVERYIGDGGNIENQYFDDLSTAPGNDVIRIKSFEILPLDGSNQITIETGVLFRLKFMCYKENAMLDANMTVSTMDDITVFQVGQMLGKIGEKDSKKGIYIIEFKIDPYTLNAGRYKTEIFFGENQRYVVFSGFEQCFEVENSLADMGFNQNVLPGMLRPKNDFKVIFEG